MSLPDSVVEPNSESEPEPESVECRPEKSQWAGVWALAFVAMMMAASLVSMIIWPDTDTRRGNLAPEQQVANAVPAVVPMIVGLVGWALGLATHIRRAFIIADGDGLRWRGVARERRARWDDVRSLSFNRTSSSNGRVRYSAETSSGRLSFGGDWSQDRELALFIERHAPLKAAAWSEKKRPELRFEWPLRLGYHTFGNLCVMPALCLLCLGCLAAVDFAALSFARGSGAAMDGSLSGPRQMVELYGWPFALLMYSLPALAVLAVPTCLGLLAFHAWMDARRRSRHLIEAKPEGIAWTDGSRTVASTWDAVRRVERPRASFFRPARTIVHTDSGEFEFTGFLSRSYLLLHLIRERAHEVPAEDWKPRSPERAGPIRDGDGLLFGYRNRSTRFAAWCVTGLSALPLLLMWLFNVTERANPDSFKGSVPWPLALAGVALAAWMWRCYHVAWIRTDDRGITKAGPLGRRFVAWQDVTKYLQDDWSNVVEGRDVDGKRALIRLHAGISGLDELLDEIENRATRSQNRAWRHRLPPVGVESASAAEPRR